MAVLNDVSLESDLRAGKQAYRHRRFSDRGKAASQGVGEIRRYQLVSEPSPVGTCQKCRL